MSRTVLYAVCHAHRLLLAPTWIPCNYDEEAVDEVIKYVLDIVIPVQMEKAFYALKGTACYVNDADMQGFVHEYFHCRW